MATKENLRQGHRARMMEKVSNSSVRLEDHELLEVLLFGLIPRVDTNPIAHKLIKTFGSIGSVFKAQVKDLMSVDGVGKGTACGLKAIGEIYSRLIDRLEPKGPKRMGSPEQAKEQVIASFEADLKEEVLKVFLLNANYKIENCLTFKTGKDDKVEVSIPDIAKVMAINKPAYLILAHNHPSGVLLPSLDDDVATKRIFLLCKIHGTELIDHFIVGLNKKVYSYRSNSRIDALNENNKLDRLFEMRDF